MSRGPPSGDEMVAQDAKLKYIAKAVSSSGGRILNVLLKAVMLMVKKYCRKNAIYRPKHCLTQE